MVEKDELYLDPICDLMKNAQENGDTFYDALYDLYVFIGLSKGIDDAKHGREITLEELHKEMEALYESTSRKFG